MKIDEFLETLNADTYPEPASDMHDDLTQKALEWVMPRVEGRQVLDIGCGQGVALREFIKRGCNAIGTTVNDEDLAACEQKGIPVIRCDMHRPTPGDVRFDLIWARHVLEHSPIPLYVLVLLREKLAPKGLLYIEVPAPGTACHHERNVNHYSVLTAGLWAELIRKAGLIVDDSRRIQFQTMAGPDEYYAYLCSTRP